MMTSVTSGRARRFSAVTVRCYQEDRTQAVSRNHRDAIAVSDDDIAWGFDEAAEAKPGRPPRLG